MGKYKSKFNGQQIDDGIEYGVRVTQQTFSSAQKQQARENIAAQETITDLKSIGCAYVTCGTASVTAAKTATLTGFELRTNCIVSVLFTYGFTTSNSTLNINNTGAKPIFYHGAAVEPLEILSNTVAILQYDGTNWNIVSKEIIARNYGDDWVDLGLPSGTLWAKKNIDVSQPDNFAVSEYQYECSFFSWGNTDGHNPISNSSFDYNWNEANYNNTTGSTITGNISLNSDAAHVILGSPWRMPTRNDFQELKDNTNASFTEIDGISGLLLTSQINGNKLFLSASGNGWNTSWNFRGTYGRYWCSDYVNSTSMGGGNIYFNNNNIIISNDYRYAGQPIRPVQ